jgi:hypothetical protein
MASSNSNRVIAFMAPRKVEVATMNFPELADPVDFVR